MSSEEGSGARPQGRPGGWSPPNAGPWVPPGQDVAPQNPQAAVWSPPAAYEPYRPGPGSYSGWVPPPPPAGGVPAPHHGGGWRALVAASVIAAMVGLGGGIGVGWEIAHNRTATTSQGPLGASTPATGTQSGSINADQVAAKVDPAVVDINTETTSGAAAGTGMILTANGEILTNNHVVNGATSISVTVADRAGTYSATVLGVSPTADVALIKIDASGLPTVKLADSSNLQIGQPVAAIGNALGQGGTPALTTGNITALDQSITATEGRNNAEQLSGMIESDASISPGDSGGALVNSAGQVIGMITAGQVAGFRSQSSTVGYAVPSNKALTIVNQIRSGKSSSDVIVGPVGYIGVQVQAFDPAIAAQLGLNVSAGVLVVGVEPGSPAEQAGMSGNSVITAIDGTSITSMDGLSAAIHSHKPGQSIRVTWVDQAGTHSAQMTLVPGPAV